MATVFYEKFKFLTELILAIGIFFPSISRRKLFLFRATGCLAITYLSAYLIPVVWYSWSNILRYLLFLLLIVVSIVICFRTTFWEALFYGVAGYAIQHFSYLVWSLLALIKPDYFSNLGMFTIWRLLLEVFAYIPFAFIFSQRIKLRMDFPVNNRSLLLLSLTMVVSAVILNYTRVIYSDSFSKVSNIVCATYSLISCLLALAVQFELLEHSNLKQELSIVEQLWHHDQEQYAISVENINLINLKCHDLKHQIALLRQNNFNQDATSALMEMEEAVSIYNSAIKTENEVLDVILTQKSLMCEKNQIKLTCMIDGESFNFIHTRDLYSIFGNIIDNAVEAVRKLENPEKRIIGITGVRSANFLKVQIENYFNSQIVFQNGLPQTTKKDKDFHGFGLKSVRLLVEKYSGSVSIHTVDDIFYLNIMIPIR